MENPVIDPEYVPARQQKPADMSVGDWIVTLILTVIPLVGFICLIVWAVSSSPEKRSRKNWAIAQFVLLLIGFVLTVVIAVAFGSALAGHL